MNIHRTIPRFFLSLVAAAFFGGGLVSMALAQDTLAELDFSTLGEGAEKGDSLENSAAHQGVTAVVGQGSIKKKGESAVLSAGPSGALGSIEIKMPKAKRFAGIEISFYLSQPEDQSNASHLFEVELRNSEQRESYVISASPNVGFYGPSGFASFNESGGQIAGTPGLALASNGTKQLIQVRFAPDSGVEVLCDGETAASFPNFKDLKKVDSITLSNAPQGGGLIRWFLNDVKVTGVSEE